MDVTVSHRELAVWKAAIALASKVYGATADLPRDEHPELALQLRRTAVAVPTSIAEGSARNNRKEFIGALRAARGSLAELETHLMIASRQQLVPSCERLLQEVADVGRSLSGLLRALVERRVPEGHFHPVTAPTTGVHQPQVP
ncbi:MAG TPA: four helix bundle protein [Paraburkholderia sp.]|uniref:four helix bundle protein n=1 Tax=Paraburkholderia sp. TaxID=1926495 RepID=UPI002B46ED4A|nr:four helix bundle protein [Paraburkholderia sp.]HKR41677.1 four helix bundle protein [Paraburkholderia sp.]